MPNTNILEGMQCPNCGSDGPFRIAITARALVFDDGTDEIDDVEWVPGGDCICVDCGVYGTVSDFITETNHA